MAITAATHHFVAGQLGPHASVSPCGKDFREHDELSNLDGDVQPFRRLERRRFRALCSGEGGTAVATTTAVRALRVTYRAGARRACRYMCAYAPGCRQCTATSCSMVARTCVTWAWLPYCCGMSIGATAATLTTVRALRVAYRTDTCHACCYAFACAPTCLGCTGTSRIEVTRTRAQSLWCGGLPTSATTATLTTARPSSRLAATGRACLFAPPPSAGCLAHFTYTTATPGLTFLYTLQAASASLVDMSCTRPTLKTCPFAPGTSRMPSVTCTPCA